MKDSLRTLVAGATGAVIASAILLGQPALADVNAKALAKDSVTSKSIKNGTVKTKDLAADVNASLAKANTALQGVADNSITNPKLADNAVANAELADNAVTSAEVAADSLGAGDLAANSVGSSELADGSVSINSLTRGGFADVAIPALANGACASVTLDTGTVTFGFLPIVSPALTAEPGLFVEGARTGSPTDLLLFRVCNRSGGAYVADTEQFLWGLMV